jgi:acyl-CoA synthetase (AMP-forming)/AMP-acid ligase II
VTALWEASDRVCGKRLKVMIPVLLPALEQRGRLRLGQPDRDRVLAIGAVRAMAKEGITMLNGVPATYQRLLEYKATAGLPRLDRGSLRLIGVAGAPLDLDLKARVEKELGLPLSNGFGITECSRGISGARSDAPRSDNAVGRLLPGIQARIVRKHGTIATNGDIGELHVRGPNVMRGYYRAPDLTAKLSLNWTSVPLMIFFSSALRWMSGTFLRSRPFR